jgi:hypothetical protein
LWTNHVAARAGSGEKHVGRNLADNVSNEKDGDTGLVLCGFKSVRYFAAVHPMMSLTSAREVEIFLEVV